MYRHLLFLSAHVLASTAALCGSACNLYSLKWDDQFSGDSVDESVWTYRTDQKALSAQLPQNVEVADGSLVINLKKEQVGSFSYTGGGVVSIPNFHYGYFEARMKLNDGTGWHSSFWLMAGNGSTTFDTSTGDHSEIDVFELDSIRPFTLSHNLNFWDGAGNRNSNTGSGAKTGSADYRDWHVFGALWTEQRVLFYIDGALSANLSFPPSRWTHDYLNVWLTSIAYQDTPDNTKLPSQVLVGNVSYYQKDYYLTALSLCRSESQEGPCPSNVNYGETGTGWATSTAVTGYTRSLFTRYSCNNAGATAIWTVPALSVGGTYDISVWTPAGRTDSDANVQIKVWVDGSQIGTTVALNQSTGSARWVVASSGVALRAGQRVEVKIYGSGGGCIRADTAKLVRIA